MSKRLSTEEFIQKAIEIHGSKYDYSKVKYSTTISKVEIICLEHGRFWQKPNNHLSGKGCFKCRNSAIKQRLLSTTKSFVEKSIKIHGEKYSYTEVKYTGNRNRVTIICSNHGMFEQSPVDHLHGAGCQICAGNKQLTTQDFINKASIVHDNKYDYSKTNYTTTHKRVEIICKEHGSFQQIAKHHLKGSGCPKCSNKISKLEIEWLNKANIPNEYRQYKIYIDENLYKVDGFDPNTNTIYEFFGDYWHGNPKRFNKNEINEHNKRTFGQLYDDTMGKIKIFQNYGYNIEYIWENDFIKN